MEENFFVSAIHKSADQRFYGSRLEISDDFWFRRVCKAAVAVFRRTPDAPAHARVISYQVEARF